MGKLEKAVVEFHAAQWKPIEASGQRGHTSAWLRTWSPKRSQAVQLDLLALISPEMFKEFFLHELEVQCSVVEQTIFHLDGPDAIKHLDLVCTLPVRAIQWVHGAGHGPMTKWLPLLKDIQSRGKGLHISCESGEVETLLKELSSKGLYMATWASNRDEADALVKLAAKHAHE